MTDPIWDGPDEPHFALPGPMGWIRAMLRGVPLAILVFGCFALFLLIRLIEAPLFGLRRPVTPHITVFVCRWALRLMGLRYTMRGVPMTGLGAMVANHSSWLNIFTLNAGSPLYFVSKSEVSRWPGIGWLARGTGTMFVVRDRKHARARTELMQERLLAGHKLLFFPEGTSTDGLQVLSFKSTLFAAFFAEDLRDEIAVQPVSVIYHAPPGESDRFYGWWGDMNFGGHLLHTLSAARHGGVEVIYHPPIPVSQAENRKTLAFEAETQVRDGHSGAL